MTPSPFAIHIVQGSCCTRNSITSDGEAHHATVSARPQETSAVKGPIRVGVALAVLGLLGIAGPGRLAAQDGADVGGGPAGAAAKPAAEIFHIDPVHSMALFRVQHLGAGAFHGRFNDVRGTIEIRPADELPVRFTVAIPVTSVDSGNERLDNHLRSADFFDAATHPEMTFATRSARALGEGFEITGDLTLVGVTRPITVRMEHIGTRDSERGKRCGYETVFTLKRSEFGMRYGLDNGALGDEVRVTVAMEASTAAPEPPAPGPGRAAGGGEGRARDLMAYDSNGDGKLEKSELPERMQRLFERMDVNQDGFIDAEEAQQAGRPRGRGEGGRGEGGRGGDRGDAPQRR